MWSNQCFDHFHFTSPRDCRAILRWGGHIIDSIWGGGHKTFFTLVLYNFKNIGGGGTWSPTPCSALPVPETSDVSPPTEEGLSRVPETILNIVNGAALSFVNTISDSFRAIADKASVYTLNKLSCRKLLSMKLHPVECK